MVGGGGRPIMYKRTKIRMTTEFYLEIMQTRNSSNIFKEPKKKKGKTQSRTICQWNISKMKAK